jgi:hypothetical protein
MKIEWRRGFFRVWAVLALAWIGLAGWHEYGHWVIRLSYVHPGECWDRFAKWPDGQNFDEWDGDDEVDVPGNVEINKKNKAWAADSIPKRNLWREAARQNIRACEAAKPILQRVALAVSDNRSAMQDSLSFVLLPPLACLVVGYIFGWIVRGFRASA